MTFSKDFENFYFVKLYMFFYMFQKRVFWQQIRVWKRPKIAKKGIFLHSRKSQKPSEGRRSRMDQGPASKPWRKFFRLLKLIFSQNWSVFHLSKDRVSSSNHLKVMAYWSLPSFVLEKQVFITASAVAIRRGETRGETWVSVNLC